MMILQISNIIIFLTLIYGFGYSFTRFLKEDNLEVTVTRLGLGLGAFPVIGIILNLLNIPLNWPIFLILALTLPLWDIGKAFLAKKLIRPTPLHLTSKTHAVILLAVFVIALLSYCKGPFNYPWLEDDDSWAHAAGIKYIAVEKNLNIPSGELQYINPYPPGYDLILGIMHQMQPDLYWTLKFFNGFFICLGFLFFYFFVKQLTGEKTKAAIATIILICTPSYLTHFIWAHSLVISLFFPAFMLYLKAEGDKRYILPASIAIASIFLIQPTQSIKFFIMIFLLMGVNVLSSKVKWRRPFAVLLLSGLISSTWWGPVLNNVFFGKSTIAIRYGLKLTTGTQETREINKLIFSPEGGSATVAYDPLIYVYLPSANLVNSPRGLGPSLFTMMAIGLLLTLYYSFCGPPDKRHIYKIFLLWFIFIYLGMNSMTFHLPIGLYAFRFWILFAILAALFASECIAFLLKFLHKPYIRTTVSILCVFMIAVTSGIYKYKLNTSTWHYGIYWKSKKELLGYVWLRKNLLPDTKVFTFVDNFLVIGNNMRSDYWDEAYKRDFKDAFYLKTGELHRRLKKHGYQYVLVGLRDGQAFGFDEVNHACDKMTESGSFQLVGSYSNATNLYRVL